MINLLNASVMAEYIERTPNPGICRVIAINWEKRTVEMTNGACRYYPSFDEIQIL